MTFSNNLLNKGKIEIGLYALGSERLPLRLNKGVIMAQLNDLGRQRIFKKESNKNLMGKHKTEMNLLRNLCGISDPYTVEGFNNLKEDMMSVVLINVS